MARDNRIDSIKGLLIILVILGHLIIALDNYNFINHCVMGFIYIFHMPLFILISGYVTKHPDNQQPRDMWKTVGNIMVTLIIFQFISSLRIYLYHGDVLSSLKGFPFGILWYLFSLICWRVMLYYTPKALLNRPLLYLIITIAVSMLSGVFHLGTFLSVQRTLNFYFFFLLGFYYRQGVFNTPLWHNNKMHIAVLVVMMPLLLWLYPRCGNVMNGADYYGIAGLPQKAMVLMCSIPMTLLMFNMGIGLILSALYMFFRDLDYLWGVFLQLLMYGSAIFYTVDKMSPKAKLVFACNPIYRHIAYFREVVLAGSVPSLETHLTLAGFAVVAFTIGAWMYHHYNTRFLYYV